MSNIDKYPNEKGQPLIIPSKFSKKFANKVAKRIAKEFIDYNKKKESDK